MTSRSDHDHIRFVGGLDQFTNVSRAQWQTDQFRRYRNRGYDIRFRQVHLDDLPVDQVAHTDEGVRRIGAKLTNPRLNFMFGEKATKATLELPKV